MFEKFGFKDVFYNVWRYKYVFLVTELLVICLTAKNCGMLSGETGGQGTKDQFCTSASYVLEWHSEKQLDTNAKFSDGAAIGNKIMLSYVALLKSDLCNDYVSKKLQSNYSEEVLSKSLVENEENLKDLKSDKIYNILDKAVRVEQSNGSSVMNISVKSNEKDLGLDVIESYKEFLKENSISENDIFTLKYIGMSQKSSRNETKEVKSLKPFIKKAFIYSVLAMTLLAIAVCFKVLFCPTLNRKSDFACYDVLVLTEIPTRLFKEKK